MYFLQQVSSQERLSGSLVAENMAFTLITLLDVMVTSTSCRPGLSFARCDWDLLKWTQTFPSYWLADLDECDSVGVWLNTRLCPYLLLTFSLSGILFLALYLILTCCISGRCYKVLVAIFS